MLLAILAVVAAACFLYYRRWLESYDHWQKRGIPYLPGEFPLGSYKKRADMKQFQGYAMDGLYQRAGQHPYFGYYAFRRPLLVMKDPEMVRFVLTKEFSHFRDRMSRDMPKFDPLMHYQLFSLRGDRWRALRTKLAPTFTSGRMKAMFPLFVDCAESLNSLLLSKHGLDFEVKDVMARFTTDVICSCAFGLQTNTTADPDHQLRKIGKDFWNAGSSLFFRIKFLVAMMLPFALPLNRVTPEEVEKYIMKLIGDTVEYREKNHINRNDFLDLLIQLKNKGTLEDVTGEREEPFEINLEAMAAQCFLFFFAGYETSSAVQTYCLYELAINEDIQDRLRQEVLEVIERNGGVTYQAVKEMKYLHMVVSETMRKYPTLPTLVRFCTRPLVTPDGGRIEAGDTVFIPVWSLQHDPQHFPDPDKFDPDRFAPENEGSIKPYTYLPFGEGPRMCIGSRFGLLQAKVGLITVLRNFEVLSCEKTRVPLKLGRAFNGFTNPDSPVFLRLVSKPQGM